MRRCDAFWDHLFRNNARESMERTTKLSLKLFWLTLVVVGGGIFTYQLTDSIIYYYDWPVTVNVKINYNDTIRFPAVTVCNQNAFRLSQAYKNNDYRLFKEVFTSSNENISLDGLGDSDRSLLDLYLLNAHTQHDLIMSCSWNGHGCHDQDLIQTVTDFGICYTFNWNQRNTRNARETGVEGGLTLLLNIEQYEYMPGPNGGAGLKLSLHGQHEQAYVRDHGLAIPPGTHGFVALKTIKIDNLPSPHGKCDDSIRLKYFNTYTVTGCQAECKMAYVKDKCNCIDMYMPGTNDTEVCSIRQYKECLLPALEKMHHIRVDNICSHCPVPCESILYEPTVSYSALSNYNMMQILESNATQGLSSHLSESLEASQRVNLASVRIDTTIINNLADTVDYLWNFISEIRSSLDQTSHLMNFMFSKIIMRTEFHSKQGFRQVKYAVDQDFIRGFDIRKERYFNYVANNYFEIGDGLRRMIISLNNTLDDSYLKMAAWLPLDNQLAGRSMIIGLANQGVVETDYAYRTATPLLNYKATVDRRYDMSFIPFELYTKRIHAQTAYVEKLVRDFNGMDNAIKIFRKIGYDFVKNGTFDEELFIKTEKSYHKHCRSYNFQIFHLEERVIKYPRIVIEERIEKFQAANTTLQDRFRQWRVAVGNINDVLESISGRNWLHLDLVVNRAKIYLKDIHTLKGPLAKAVVSHQTMSSVHQIDALFKDLRSRALDLLDAWTEIEWAYKIIWTNMLTETSTKGFYEKVRADFVDYVSSRGLEARYIRFFASLLGTDSKEISTSYPNEQLVYRLNADFADTNWTTKMEDITMEFESISGTADVSSRIGDKDILLYQQFMELHQRMEDFVSESKINSKFVTDNFMRLDVFMRELSYEQITQQPAYDVIKLLGKAIQSRDIGGSLGLFLGASVLTIFELIDAFLHHALRLACRR
ncbi:hypothetical protein CAPTEDRAFT_212993 [Capitella teleta]|uniref:Uncharacterized protein n=1 Tax=Capitella teleta TaxID=283909 RepID=R7TTP5_CAPTE|nr:hypothetical protein CAPTEDRAFT_212993 [Capitella teleta]|eukprot:ELT94811.1 hypothetical protein CAPTEDRAFT_212993 [Capitella teleta]